MDQGLLSRATGPEWKTGLRGSVAPVGPCAGHVTVTLQSPQAAPTSARAGRAELCVESSGCGTFERGVGQVEAVADRHETPGGRRPRVWSARDRVDAAGLLLARISEVSNPPTLRSQPARRYDYGGCSRAESNHIPTDFPASPVGATGHDGATNRLRGNAATCGLGRSRHPPLAIAVG